MKRIDADGYVANGNGSGRNGFTNGDPALETPGTLADASWHDHVQEEIARSIEIHGGTLDSGNKEQLAGIIGGRAAGPASSTDNALVRFDGTTGKLLQNSGATLTDAGNMSVPGTLFVDGDATFDNNIGVNGIIAGGDAVRGTHFESDALSGTPVANAIYAILVPKVVARVSSNGGGSASLLWGVNVASVAISGTDIVVTIDRDFASANNTVPLVTGANGAQLLSQTAGTVTISGTSSWATTSGSFYLVIWGAH